MGFVVTVDATVTPNSVDATVATPVTSLELLLHQASAMRNVDGMIERAGR